MPLLVLSTYALNNNTLYIVKLANKGYREALLSDEGFLRRPKRNPLAK
ncbi:hypothetical protein O9992_15760 [Vibrio lentus]|nr:hypothetical protein [Vibrio lentus]